MSSLTGASKGAVWDGQWLLAAAMCEKSLDHFNCSAVQPTSTNEQAASQAEKLPADGDHSIWVADLIDYHVGTPSSYKPTL